MRRHIISAGLITVWIMLILPASAEAKEWMTTNVFLNNEDHGDFLITLTDEGKILFARKDLMRIGIKDIPTEATGDDGYVSLSPRVRAELDRNTSILYLTIDTGPSQKLATERMSTTVHLNGEKKGIFLITLTEEGKILFTRKDLLRLGITEIPTEATIGDDGYVSLSPQVRAELDKNGSILHLTVQPALLGYMKIAHEGASEGPSSPALTAPLPAALPAVPVPTLTHAPTRKSASGPAATSPNAGQRAVVNVQLNHETKGDFFVTLKKNGEILIARDDLQHLGITQIPAGVTSESDATVDISSLAPSVQSEFSEKDSTLFLTADPALLGKTTIDLARNHPLVEGVIANGTSAFINYGISYTADDNLDFSTLSMPLEAGITANGYLGVSSFSYLRDVNDSRFVRLMTSVVKDDPPTHTRIIAGDFSTSSGMLGSGGLYGGLSIATNFSIDPYSLRYPGANLYGAVNTPSDVEVYVNGLLVGKSHLSPGEFEFLNVGNVQGSGEATMVLKDAYGQQQTITVPYYTSTQLLKPGLQDYSYSVGYQRKAFGQESNQYGDPAFLGYHRIGISDVLTAGLRAEADADVTNVGANATFLVGTLGEFDTSVAFSRENSISGQGWAARFTRSSRYVSTGLFIRGYSRGYANLAMTSSDDKSRLEASGNIGFRQSMLGNISLFYSMKHSYIDIDRRRFGVNYNRRLASDVSLNIVTARTVTETTTSNEIFANLMILLGKAKSANVSYQRQGNEIAARVSLQQNAPLGTGLGYRLSADRRDDGQNEPTNGEDAYVQYRGNHGIYSAEHRIIDGSSTSTVGTAGGIAFINHSAYFTRPIYDGFVVAKVGAFENVKVNYNNQEMGVTDKNGEILIPGLISYHLNNVSINDKDIPVNYELSEISKSVTVPYRAGSVVNFDMKKLQGFTGRIFIREDGKKAAAEYWGLKITVGGEAREVVVGKKGEFYLENLHAGSFTARLFSKDQVCSFVLSIPDSDAAMVDMGEVICEKS